MTILPDVLADGLRVVFCGTAPGNESARQRAYYAHPGNRFWPTLFETGLTPRRIEPPRFRDVLQFGIGLTDLAKQTFGADVTLQRTDFDRERLERKILRYRPRIVAFTSKRAAFEYLGCAAGYGLHPERIGETRLFVLPSPSGQARSHWDIEVWHALARLVSEAS